MEGWMVGWRGWWDGEGKIEVGGRCWGGHEGLITVKEVGGRWREWGVFDLEGAAVGRRAS